MNLFDKEERIIECFQNLKKSEILIYPSNRKLLTLFNSIYKEKEWKKWTNSSSKSDLPPDYYNDKLKIMMDVMRIDDHAYIDEKGRVINPHNQRESQLRKEFEQQNPELKKASEEGRFIINPYTNLPTEKDHNYLFYLNNFNRVVKKHIDKIPTYLRNHRGYKVIFLVFDESSPYIENYDSDYEKFTEVGQMKYAKPHFWWIDTNFIEIIKESKIDYLIWVTPYKHFDSLEKIELPRAVIYELSKAPYARLYKYDNSKMESLEM